VTPIEMSCPPEHVIAAFAEGRLSQVEREPIELHLDTCSDCGRVVADFARIWSDRSLAASAPGSGEATRPAGGPDSIGSDREIPVLAAGTSVGRYRVLECVGIGGMGVVYGAYDPELDRRIALKLLRGRGVRDRERNARLLREAQAMARLAHPNVITVYDVGTHAHLGDPSAPPLVFLAMEFVRGSTLGAWSRARRRTWPELREVIVAAGRGLAAAHAAGLVHRDFKPDNVLVGDDGRVRVTDFGLARMGPSRSVDDEEETPAPRVASSGPPAIVTETGTLLGTPAYMAPEQYGAGEVGPAADQFAFCVTLFEAAYGMRPFGGKTFVELATRVADGTIRPPPPGRELPARVHAAIERGLSAEPRERFPDMDALLSELGADPRRRRRRRLALASLAVLGILATAALLPGRGATAIAFCRDDGDVRAAWQRRHRDATAAALRGTKVAYAEATSDAVVARLDDWVAQFEAERQLACDAPGARSGDPELSTMMRVQCLRRQRAAFDAAVDVLEHASAETIVNAAATVEAIGDPERCSAEPTTELPPEPPAADADAVEEARQRLARVEALLWGSRFDEADAEISSAREIAERVAFGPLSAEIEMWSGRALANRGDPAAGAEALERAAWSAVEARDRRLAVRAFSALAYTEGTARGQIASARRAARAARAELRALGGDPWLEGNLLLDEGAAELTAGNFERARTAFRDALATGAFEDRPMSRADLFVNLGAVASDLHEFDEALAMFERARALYETHVGPRHPVIGSVLFDTGATLYRKGDSEEALDMLRRAAEIEEETIGAAHPTHANTIAAIGTVLSALGREDEALSHLQRAVAILEAAGEGQRASLALQRVNLASTLYEMGRLDEAERHARMGHAESLEQVGDGHVHVATAESLLGSIARARGDLATAEDRLSRALEIRKALYPATHADIVYTQVELAEIVADRGRSADAVALLDELLALHPDPAAAPGELAWARFLVVRERLAMGEPAHVVLAQLDAIVLDLRTHDEIDRVARVEAWRRALRAQ
jgi:tetratricopeptide (TPR) repeat protein/tRNA A-37 threonylcarbamoyl transferase component Bud32